MNQFQFLNGLEPKWTELLPDESERVNTHHFDKFFEIMYERQEAWYNRFVLLKEKPWCNDPILQVSKFTNVYRELDRSSQYLIHKVIRGVTKEYDYTFENLIWHMLIYRLYNKPDGFEKGMLKIPMWFPDKKFKKIGLHKLYKQTVDYRENVDNPWHTAYLMNIAFLKKTAENTPARGLFKDYAYVKVAFDKYWEMIPEICNSMKTAEEPEDVIKTLEILPACSGFQSHEFFIDMCYLNRYSKQFSFKFDQNDYTNVGPGASLGIRLIFPSLKPKEQKLGIYSLRDKAEKALSKYPFKFLEWDKRQERYYTTDKANITLHQIEMWLCEYQKYWKMIIGAGKQRSKFKAMTDNNSYGKENLI